VEENNFPGQFKKLEDRIEELIQKCRDFQQTESQLKTKIHDLEGDLKAKADAEQEYTEEKTMVRTKIDDLLNRLDQVVGSN
jgi:chromosome segregation ATPase